MKHGDLADSAVTVELVQMLEKEVWKGVKFSDLSYKQKKKIIHSFLFLKEKYLPSGEFDKLKARLVGGGDQQDKDIYENISSPTVALTHALLVAGIAAKEHRNVAVMDIGGAYLNAHMKEEVLMRLDPEVSALLIKLDPSYKQFLTPDGCIIVKLLKAIYGCIESALLWFEHLRGSLLSLGFTQNEIEPCVFNRLASDGIHQCTVCIYVDDLFTSCVLKEELELLRDQLIKIYKEIKFIDDKTLPYLGMQFDYSVDGCVKITMPGYVDELLDSLEITGTAVTPASLYLFDVRDDIPLLDADAKKEFHTTVAKLLYLGKRVRPEILPAVSFLSSRVHDPTDDDQRKLHRLLKYLNGDRYRGIVIEPGDTLELKGYIDASYGVHSDFKSHTGCVIALGAGPVYVKSSKQKIVTKSSAEAELVGLSDECSQIIGCRSFLLAQGYDLPSATVYQYNQSTMAMAEKGAHTSSRTRHINIRYFFIKDRIASGDIAMEYLQTSNMIADIMTKPLQGELFRKFRDQMSNWKF